MLLSFSFLGSRVISIEERGVDDFQAFLSSTYSCKSVKGIIMCKLVEQGMLKTHTNHKLQK